MKKTLSLLTALIALAPFSAKAESAAGGVEVSGNIDVVTGWQHDDSDALGTPIGGQLGSFRGATSPRRDTFNFYLDQVELNLNKNFGDKIRIRADIDLGREASGSNRNTEGFNVSVEQAYVTVGIGEAELLVGRFNAPIGYYLVDRADNLTLSFSNIYNYTTPANVTGAKVYYAFNEMIDLNVYVVNNLADTNLNTNSAIPSYGMRLGFNWGEENQKSTIGISYAGGPERLGCNGIVTDGCNKHLTHIADLDVSWRATEQLTVGAEFLFRQDNSITAGVANDRVWGGLALVNYDVNESWRVYGRYGFLQDRTAFYTGTNQNLHDFALGVGYQITDGAKLKLEYAGNLYDPRGVAAAATTWSHGVAAELAYNF